MTTTITSSTIKTETMLQSSFENHRKIFAHLKAAEKYLEITLLASQGKIVPLGTLNK